MIRRVQEPRELWMEKYKPKVRTPGGGKERNKGKNSSRREEGLEAKERSSLLSSFSSTSCSLFSSQAFHIKFISLTAVGLGFVSPVLQFSPERLTARQAREGERERSLLFVSALPPAEEPFIHPSIPPSTHSSIHPSIP